MQTLILHVGTPKTGTTALQHYLDQNRAGLERAAIWHPPFFGSTPSRRHQWLVDGLLSEDRAGLAAWMTKIEADRPAGSRTIVLSSEGLYRLWWEFSASAREWLASLKSRYHVQIWVWFREPVAFASAAYLQYLKGLPGVHPGLGRDVSLEQMLDEPWFARQLDYEGFVRDARALFGAEAVRTYGYDGNTVTSFLSALGLPPILDEPRRNLSMGERGAGLVRAVNARNLEPPERAKAIALINGLAPSHGDGGRPFRPSAAAIDRIRSLASSSMPMLSELRILGWAA